MQETVSFAFAVGLGLFLALALVGGAIVAIVYLALLGFDLTQRVLARKQRRDTWLRVQKDTAIRTTKHAAAGRGATISHNTKVGAHRGPAS